MSLNKLIIIFGIILAIFAGVVFFQFSARPGNKSVKKIASNTVTIKNHTFIVELAQNSKDQQIGLSGRLTLPSDRGMLFLFGSDDYYDFWMKNTKLPLDIIFIKDDKIDTIVKNAQPPKSTKVDPEIYRSQGKINKVLEINGGLSDKYKLKTGDKVDIKL